MYLNKIISVHMIEHVLILRTIKKMEVESKSSVPQFLIILYFSSKLLQLGRMAWFCSPDQISSVFIKCMGILHGNETKFVESFMCPGPEYGLTITNPKCLFDNHEVSLFHDIAVQNDYSLLMIIKRMTSEILDIYIINDVYNGFVLYLSVNFIHYSLQPYGYEITSIWPCYCLTSNGTRAYRKISTVCSPQMSFLARPLLVWMIFLWNSLIFKILLVP